MLCARSGYILMLHRIPTNAHLPLLRTQPGSVLRRAQTVVCFLTAVIVVRLPPWMHPLKGLDVDHKPSPKCPAVCWCRVHRCHPVRPAVLALANPAPLLSHRLHNPLSWGPHWCQMSPMKGKVIPVLRFVELLSTELMGAQHPNTI